MVNVCRTILHQRARQTGETSNRDLLHMMIQNRSEPIGKSNDSACPYSGKRVLDEKSIVSNMVLFYEAGFETSSTALTFMAHLLTTFPANQRRMRAEVLRVLYRNQLLTTDDSLSDDLTDFELCNASFHYDRKQLQRKLTLSVLRQMHWLDCFIRESLRMYPPVWNFVNRESQPNATFFVPELNRTITCQGQFQINFPVIHIHYDPNYWRHPLCFRPQRFSTLISDRSLTAAESAEQQLELDPFSLKDDPSFHFSDSQTQSHDILPEPLDSGDDDDVDAKNVNDQQAGTTDKSDGDQPLLEMSADDDDSSNTSVTKSLLKRIDSAHYMPFGIGPRNCVGMRFALLEIKLALCMMLLEFELTPDSTKSPKPKPGHLDIEFKSITIASKEEIVAKFKPNPLIQCDLN